MYLKKIKISEAEIMPTSEKRVYAFSVNGKHIGTFVEKDLNLLHVLLKDDKSTGFSVAMKKGNINFDVFFHKGKWIYIEIDDNVYKEHIKEIDF